MAGLLAAPAIAQEEPIEAPTDAVMEEATVDTVEEPATEVADDATEAVRD